MKKYGLWGCYLTFFVLATFIGSNVIMPVEALAKGFSSSRSSYKPASYKPTTNNTRTNPFQFNKTSNNVANVKKASTGFASPKITRTVAPKTAKIEKKLAKADKFSKVSPFNQKVKLVTQKQRVDRGKQLQVEATGKQVEATGKYKTPAKKFDIKTAQSSAVLKKVKLKGNYTDASIPAAAIYSYDAINTAAKHEEVPITVSTASIGGAYTMFAQHMDNHDGDFLSVKVLPGAGSLETLQKLYKKEVDSGIVQADAMNAFEEVVGDSLDVTSAPLYLEPMQIIANTDGISDISDIDKNTVVYVGPENSGSELSWKRMVMGNYALYGKVPETNVRNCSFEEGLSKVAANKKAIMLVVSGLKSMNMKKADQMAASTGKLRLIPVTDSSLFNQVDKNKKYIYSAVTIPEGTYPALQKGGWWGTYDVAVPTLAVRAVYLVKNDWIKNNGLENYENLQETVAIAISKMYPLVGGIE